jgi:hypothetical protein
MLEGSVEGMAQCIMSEVTPKKRHYNSRKLNTGIPISNRCRRCSYRIDEFDSVQIGEDPNYRICLTCHDKTNAVSRLFYGKM